MLWTWNKMVNLEKGAVTVLATAPAIPPHQSCLAASADRDFEENQDA